MDRGAWRDVVHGVNEESDMTNFSTRTHARGPEMFQMVMAETLLA